jgi:hypothetical protein
MSKEEKDFRANRQLLPPDAFLFAEGPDLPPKGLVPESVWHSIMDLPDDVALRTSADHGKELACMHNLWSFMIESTGETEDVMYHALLNVSDELMACIVNSLQGFYGVAASCLRTALDLATNGAYYQRCQDLNAYKNWEEKQGAVNFGGSCDLLNNLNDVKLINDYLFTKMKHTLLEQKNSRYQDYEGGWVRKLHFELSNFVHSKPAYSHVDLWDGSNGPIYVQESFGRIFAMYCETSALITVLIKIARPTFRLPTKVLSVFKLPNLKPSKLAVYTYQYLWKKELGIDRGK